MAKAEKAAEEENGNYISGMRLSKRCVDDVLAKVNAYNDKIKDNEMEPSEVKAKLKEKVNKEIKLLKKKGIVNANYNSMVATLQTDLHKIIDTKTKLVDSKTTSETDWKKTYNELKKELSLEKAKKENNIALASTKKDKIVQKIRKARKGW